MKIRMYCDKEKLMSFLDSQLSEAAAVPGANATTDGRAELRKLSEENKALRAILGFHSPPEVMVEVEL